MSVGKEYLRQLHEALADFEEAITARENRVPFTGKVTAQQAVDNARDAVVRVVVDIVTADRLKPTS
jgi:hypothetical protein